jgi:hypothetical protein
MKPFHRSALPAACAMAAVISGGQAMAADTSIASSGTAFNPAIGVILGGTYSVYRHNPDDYVLSGFPLMEDALPVQQGLSLGETELSFSANIDDQFYGAAVISIDREGAVDVEEAYIQTLSLPEGFTTKAGRFFSGIGYLNSVHAHAWDFVDQPLVYRAMLANQLGDDGVQLRWVAPTPLLVEFGGEVLRGDAYPGANGAHKGVGTKTAFINFGGDVGVSNSWRAGISYVNAAAVDRESGDPAAPDMFTGSSRLGIFNAVWKWAPLGNPTDRNFKAQFEYFQRHEDGAFTTGDGSVTDAAYKGDQSGWYVQAVYQFMPKWRIGLRYDALRADATAAGLEDTALDRAGHDPSRTSAMVDFSNSEFSRIRLQYNRDESGPQTDDQWYLQYVMSIGAHGAHQF